MAHTALCEQGFCLYANYKLYYYTKPSRKVKLFFKNTCQFCRKKCDFPSFSMSKGGVLLAIGRKFV